MRSLVGVLFVCSVVGSSACNDRGLGLESKDGGRTVDCRELDETQCAAEPSCVVDRCPLCDCDGGTSYGGCRGKNQIANGCPAIACDDSACCSKYDEASCGSHSGCSPIYCDSCVAWGENQRVYQGCFGPNAGAPLCPETMCPIANTCAQSDECPDGQFCHATGSDWGCYGCDFLNEGCAKDSECGSGRVCSFTACDCAQMTQGVCTAPCGSNNDCRTGQVCSNKHCVTQTCDSAHPCPSQFSCSISPGGTQTCTRSYCADDVLCADGFCVDGKCYDNPGMCTWLPD